jgi:hypothetical protein
VSVDYPLVVVGASGEKASNVAKAGKVYTFLLTPNPMPLGVITSPIPVIGQRFGFSVDVNNHQLLVGTWQGAKAFTYSFAPGSPWNLVSELKPHDGSGSFGYSVAIVNDVALVGAPYDTGYRGAVYEYKDVSGTWWEVSKHYSPAVGAGYFGISVDLNENGRRGVVGAHSAYGTGAAFVFDLH